MIRDRSRVPGVLAVASFATLAACASDTEPSPGFSVRDSAGVTIAENTGQPVGTIDIAPEPSLVLGVADGDPVLQFANVTAAVLTADANVAVADGLTREIRLFDMDGGSVGVLGGEGQGPGEFTALSALFVRGDSLVAQDMRAFRFTVFDEHGEVIRTTPEGVAPIIGFFEDGRLVSYDVLTRDMPPPGSVTRARLALFVHDGEGGAPRRIFEYDANERYVHTEIPGFSDRIFGRNAWALIQPQRVVIADNGSYELKVLEADGTLVQLIRKSTQARLATPELVSRYVDEALASAGPRLEMSRMTYRDQPRPERLPAFGRSGAFRSRLPVLVGGPQDELWVLDYLVHPEDRPTWSVFDRAGQYSASVTFPPGFSLTDVGADHLVGVSRDALEVEHVVVYRYARE